MPAWAVEELFEWQVCGSHTGGGPDMVPMGEGPGDGFSDRGHGFSVWRHHVQRLDAQVTFDQRCIVKDRRGNGDDVIEVHAGEAEAIAGDGTERVD